MDEFIDQFDFGVDVFLDQVVKNNVADGERHKKGDRYIVPLMLKVKVNRRYRNSHGCRSEENEHSQFHTANLLFVNH